MQFKINFESFILFQKKVNKNIESNKNMITYQYNLGF